MRNNPLISIIIVNYNGEKFLKNLFESILNQSYSNYEIIILDNNSTDNSIKYIENSELYKKITLINSTNNIGFAKGNNVAVREAKGEYLLFLNSDTALEKNTIQNLVNTISEYQDAAGVAPKIYLSKFLPKKIFDSVGICMDFNGSPYNRGIGQVDMGQYDYEEKIMGLCFACALVNRNIYVHSGRLDNSYFAYFEDVDWSFRIRKLGYNFYSSPNAIVYHDHSATTSKNSYSWKYYLIFRNYLRTATKTFGKKNALRVVKQKLLDLIKLIIIPSNSNYSLRLTALKIILNYLFFDLWKYSLKRLSTRKHFNKNISDESIFKYSKYEPSNFFDPVTYQPIFNSIELYQHVLRRKTLMYVKNKKSKIKNEWKELKKRFYSSYYTGEWKKEFDDFVNFKS